MALPPLATVPPELERMAWQWAHKLRDAYRRGVRVAAADYVLLAGQDQVAIDARGRIAEIAFCLWARLDPLLALDWGLKPDRHYDCVYIGRRKQIKTSAWGILMIWPLIHNHKYPTRQFDDLVLVLPRPSPAGPSWSIEGQMTKQRFWAERKTAPARHKLLPGTWYVDPRENPLDELPIASAQERWVDGVRLIAEMVRGNRWSKFAQYP